MKTFHYFVLLLLAMTVSAEARTWTAKTGHTINGEFVKLEGETVLIQLPDGKLAKIKLDLLLDENQQFVQNATKKKDDDSPFIIDDASPTPAKETMEKSRKAGERMTLKISDVEYAFRWCPAGTFKMGSPDDEKYPDDKKHRNKNEVQHQVTLSRGFWMLETEVTQEMWTSIMEKNPSKNEGVKRPVEYVSWDNCQEYIKKLNDLGVAPAGFEFSLPTEAQWEYACRAGTTTTYASGNSLNQNLACFLEKQTREVGSYRANAWGFRDMHGNIEEWCLDVFGEYSSDAVTDPTDPVVVTYETARVCRGGEFYNYGWNCRSAARNWRARSSPSAYLGLRLALVHAKEKP